MKKVRKKAAAKAKISLNLPITPRGGEVNPIDVHVGNQLRIRRTILGLSQHQLADTVNITFQQIQKYEKGANRISASRLFQFATALDVPVGYFFEGFAVSESKGKGHFNSDKMPANPLESPDVLELIRAYQLISSVNVRKQALALIRVLGGTDKDDDK